MRVQKGAATSTAAATEAAAAASGWLPHKATTAWGVQECGSGERGVGSRQAYVVERLVGHSVMPHNIDLQPVKRPSSLPLLPLYDAAASLIKLLLTRVAVG